MGQSNPDPYEIAVLIILIALALLIRWQSHDSTFFYLRIIISDNWIMQLILDISVHYFNTLVGITMKESDSLASLIFLKIKKTIDTTRRRIRPSRNIPPPIYTQLASS